MRLGLLFFLEAPRAPAPDPGKGLSTPAEGPNTYIGLNSSMRSITMLSEHVCLQADEEQVLCRELVCVCEELQSCCEHAASALTVHPRVQTLFLTRLFALLQTGTTSEWMCGENTEQQIQQERRTILELPVVSGISDVTHGKRCGFRVNLRCHVAQEHGNCECCGLKRRVPVLVSSTRTTLLECLQEVLQKKKKIRIFHFSLFFLLNRLNPIWWKKNRLRRLNPLQKKLVTVWVQFATPNNFGFHAAQPEIRKNSGSKSWADSSQILWKHSGFNQFDPKCENYLCWHSSTELWWKPLVDPTQTNFEHGCS